MKYKWLNKKRNNKIIIFFNGWGMDENVVKHLEYEDYDILMFYDYNTLETNFNFEILNIYHVKNIIAWSMGVMIAACLIPSYIPVFFSYGNGTCTAINGTLRPIDAEFGIHPRVYDLTIKGFDEKGRNRFINSMFDEKCDICCSRDIQNQRQELIALRNYQANTNFRYNKVLISDNDKIISTKAQVNFWQIEPNLKGGHCPFFKFEKWSELL